MINFKRNLDDRLNILLKYDRDPQVRSQYFSSLNQYRKLRKMKSRQYRQEIINKLDSLYESNPKEYWKLLDQLKSKDNSFSEDASHVPENEWYDYFKHLNEDTFTDKLLNDLEKDKIFNELDYIISQEEILKAIKDLKNNKAAGFDTIINEMLKCGQSVLVKPLSKLCNIILSSGEYPSQWSKGYIHPIHKSGEKDNPSNYRGIAINSCIGKLFTKILNSRLNEFLAKRNVIPIEQIGFTKTKRTVDHMFILGSLVEQHTKRVVNLYTHVLLISEKHLTQFGSRDFSINETNWNQ